MERKIFSDFYFTNFWNDSEYALKEYVEEYPDDDLIGLIEAELGYKFPSSYIEFMKLHNGGIPNNCCFPINENTSWAEDHVAINGIMGIGRIKKHSLCGMLGSQFMIDEWGYPNTGIFICDCPSAGHDMIMLDYSECGADGEPQVVHVDQERDYKKTFLAKNFESFIKGLVNEEVYDTSEQDLTNTLEAFNTGRFSDVLQKYFIKDKTVDFDKVLRNIFTEITKEHQYFCLYSDALSYLAYDIQFYLLSINKKINSREEFIKLYPHMTVFGNNEINMKGYGPASVEDWFDEKIKNKEIAKTFFRGYKFTADYKREVFKQIKKYE